MSASPDGQTDKCNDWQAEVRTDKHMDRQTDRQMDNEGLFISGVLLWWAWKTLMVIDWNRFRKTLRTFSNEGGEAGV